YADADVELIESSVHPQRGPSLRPVAVTTPDVEDEDFDFDEAPMSKRALSDAPDIDIEEIQVDAPPGRPFMGSAPDVEVEDEDLGHEEIAQADKAYSRKAVVDAESFRGLRLYSKAIETLRMALEGDPQSLEIREKLRDIL